MSRELRPYQAEALKNLRLSIGQGVRRIVLQGPCGFGKTLLAAEIANGARRKNKKLAFCVPFLSLIDQTVEEFYKEGIRDIGVVQAQHVLTDWSKPIQICSIQTLQNRNGFPEADVVIFDEIHRLFSTHRKWLTDPAWKDVPFIGLSASPFTKGLGKYFETLLIAATTQELIDQGYLSPFRVYAAGHPDLSQVKIVAGEYQEDQLSNAMQAGTLTADIVRTWQEKWGKDKTLCFGVDCAHAQNLQKRFQEAGISCAYQDAKTPSSERAEIKRKFHSGEYRIISNVDTLSVGVDFDVRCLILARPTRSESRFVQIIGRGLRTAPGKSELIILDHSDTTQRLGFVTDIFHDHLDSGKPKDAAKAVEKKIPLPKECPACAALRPRGRAPCPHCGHVPEVISGVIEQDGELVELTPGKPKKKAAKADRVYTMEEKADFYGQLKYLCKSKGYKDGWSAMKFKERFGAFPRGLDHVGFKPPSITTLSWLRSRQIAWAKSKHRNEAHA